MGRELLKKKKMFVNRLFDYGLGLEIFEEFSLLLVEK